MNIYLKWIKSFFITVLVTSFSILLFNYYIDSFNLFSQSNSNLAKDLQNGYYISGENIDSNRVDNIYEPLIRNIKELDFLAIGSSRTMLLHKDILFGKKHINYYNFTDGTARLRHYAKIFGLLNKYNIQFPHTVILGLDPWIFDEKASIVQIKQLLNNPKSSNSNYLQLFNYEYTKINILSLINNIKYTKSTKLEDLRKSKNIIISPSGDLYNPLHDNSITLDNLLKKVENVLKECDEKNANTKCVKYSKLNNFKEVKYMFNYLKNRGVDIIVYLAPFEPTFYQHIVKYNNFTKYNSDILEFLSKNNIEIVGSYNPADLNLTSSYFLDSVHPNEDAIKLIFKNIELDKFR